MGKIIPHTPNYVQINKLKEWSFRLLVSSAVLSVLIIFIEKVPLQLPVEKVVVKEYINALLALLAITYFVLDVITNNLYLKAELIRKNGLIDNSLNTQLADAPIKGYFSNDTIEYGIYKLGVNSFENSFFSKNISRRMIPKMITNSGIIFILFLLVIFFSEKDVLIILAKISLPFTMIQQTVRLIVYNDKLNRTFDTYKTIFTSVDKSKQNALILDNVISQEMTLAWARISLSGTIYKKINPTLEKEWEVIKNQLGLSKIPE